MLTFYVFQDDAVPGGVKIGKDTAWPNRFKQARCHTPGSISVTALFQLPDMDRSGQEHLDSLLKAVLQPHVRDVSYNGAGVQEWYNLDADAAVHKISQIPEFAEATIIRNVQPSLPVSQLDYEDWRDRGKSECRWRAFLFQVVDLPDKSGHSHVGRLKISAGSLYDTAYRYNFTYNPFPVVLIGGFETDLAIDENNKKIMDGWHYVVTNFGNGAKSQPMGWLREGVSPNEVKDALERFNCKSFSLFRHKPEDARPKDPSLGASLIGAPYSWTRVSDFFNC